MDRWIESRSLYSGGSVHGSKESYGFKKNDVSDLISSEGDGAKNDPSKNGEYVNGSR